MNIKNVNQSMIAGGSINDSVNGNNNDYDKTIKQVQKTSFWISLVTGIISSLIASIVYNWLCN